MTFRWVNPIRIDTAGQMASFGCNFSGNVWVKQVTTAIETGLAIARDYGFAFKSVGLADSMGWATPICAARGARALARPRDLAAPARHARPPHRQCL
jgi:hypothetical protein